MSNETTQTAVEWYINLSEELYKQWINRNITLEVYNECRTKLKEQAKEKEKEQIEDAFYQGENNSVDYFNPENRIKESEQYYNETYGGNK